MQVYGENKAVITDTCDVHIETSMDMINRYASSSIRPNFVVVMLPSSGKFEILGRSVGFFFFYCIVHEFKLITKCTSFVNQSTMTQSKENIQ